MGPLLGYFLAPDTTGLTFEDVARRVLLENQREAEVSVADLRVRRKELQQEIKLPIQSRDLEADKEKKKPFKKRLDLRRRTFERWKKPFATKNASWVGRGNVPQQGGVSNQGTAFLLVPIGNGNGENAPEWSTSHTPRRRRYPPR